MKTLEIQIKSIEQARAESIEAFKNAQSGKKMPPVKTRVYFASLEAVRAVLTDKRLKLLHLVRQYSPHSINQLASIARRDFKNVYTDVMLLKNCGLIQLGKHGKTSKTVRQTMSVPYQAINIHAVV